MCMYISSSHGDSGSEKADQPLLFVDFFLSKGLRPIKEKVPPLDVEVCSFARTQERPCLWRFAVEGTANSSKSHLACDAIPKANSFIQMFAHASASV